ncbi:hypothetical protein W824_03105 [Clavibacter cf. michiganensis LMG 26808]|uniref:Uncharacterized protein n=1 Tax=Clavibacter michiganensis TaxID=28447 RepID=A0A399NX53_9MICO|nr:hypothetical protein W824_03105 [Clavibacter cf. michiganensis LMG 26808]RII98742.1 hypothetical protein DZF96_01745 [Clavibacter michiganensis]
MLSRMLPYHFSQLSQILLSFHQHVVSSRKAVVFAVPLRIKNDKTTIPRFDLVSLSSRLVSLTDSRSDCHLIRQVTHHGFDLRQDMLLRLAAHI